MENVREQKKEKGGDNWPKSQRERKLLIKMNDKRHIKLAVCFQFDLHL